jgi:glycerophosphoryl diester phosphodiesterase
MKHALLSFLVVLLTTTCSITRVAPLPNAHAHNDYEHRRPLRDALAYGFTSVEADIHLVNGELYVSHDAPDTAQARTLRQLYLEPLQRRVARNKGRVYRDYPGSLVLLVDLKTEAEATYAVLREQLLPYKALLVRTEGDESYAGPLHVILSGNRPTATVARETLRLVGIDGRPADLDSTANTAVMPLISYNYTTLVKWNGLGEMPPTERETLQTLAERTHAQGKKLRLWATPESEHVWATLRAIGVDYLNTDQLERLQSFLLNAEEERNREAPNSSH